MAQQAVGVKRACESCRQSHVACMLTEGGCLRCRKRGQACVSASQRGPRIRKPTPHTFQWTWEHEDSSPFGSNSSLTAEPIVQPPPTPKKHNEDVFAGLTPLDISPSYLFTTPYPRERSASPPRHRAIESPRPSRVGCLCPDPLGMLLPCAHAVCRLCMISYMLACPCQCRCGAPIHEFALAPAVPLS